MPLSPSGDGAILRPDIADALVEFDAEMAMEGYVATQVLPIFEVKEQTANFGKLTLKELMKDQDVARASGAAYARTDFKLEQDNYTCEEYGIEIPVDERNARIYQRYFDSEVQAARIARSVILREHEKRVAALLFNTTTFSGKTSAVTTEWSTTASATILADVKTAMKAVKAQCGVMADTMLISDTVWFDVIDNAGIIDRVKYNEHTDVKRKQFTTTAIADALGLKRIIVANGVKNTAKEGQSVSIADIWDDEYALIFKMAEGNDLESPSLGHTFHWNMDGSSPKGTVETYYSTERRANIVRVRHDVDEKVKFVEAGYLLSNIRA